MANFFGQGVRANSATPVSLNARIQSSVQGRPRSIGAGQNRLSGNLIGYWDFKALPVSTSQGGKGGAGGAGKGSPTSYSYSATFVISLGETISAVQAIFNGNQIDFLATPPSSVLADLAALGITPTYGNTYGITVFAGDYSQTAWSYLVSAHPTQALAYRGEALACFANMGLGSSPTLPNFGFELLWALNSDIPAVGPDANPADWVNAFLTNTDWGVGFPAALMGDLSAYRTWARATGMLISPVLTNQSAGNSHLADIMKGTIADFRWSSGLLTVVPYGDAAVTGNGYTYTPSVTPLYDLTITDFQPNQGSSGGGSDVSPISVSRRDPGQVLNQVKVEYLDRSNLYNPVVIYNQDDALIVAAQRLRPSDLRAHHFFCLGNAASISAALQMHREKVLATYQFTLPATFILIDVMDILTLTETNLGLVRQAVRVTDIQENADRTLTFTAEEYLGTVAAPLYSRQQTLGTGRNNNVAPGNVNTPILFEPTSKQSYAAAVWGAVSGANPALWGGCQIWASYDNVTYAPVATVSGAARTGVLTATLPAVAAAIGGQTVDNTNTLSVDLSQSAGALASGSSSDMLGLNTICYVDGEIIAYQNATLTSANHYNLSPMVRGAYGTPISSHAIGSSFARIDDSLFMIPYSPDRIGATLYLKFLSFNIFGAGRQALSDVSPYTYTILGVNQDQLQILNILTGDGPGSLADTLGQITQSVATQSDATVNTQITTKQITGKNSAAVLTESSARVTGDAANATLIQQAIAQFNTNFASSLIKFNVLATDNLTYASLAMMCSVGTSGTFIESGIRIYVSVSGGILTSQIQLLTQNLVVTDGTHTAQSFSFDTPSGSLVLNTLLFQSLKDISGLHVSINGNTGAMTLST